MAREPGGVWISPGQMYDTLQELTRAVQGLQTAVDGLQKAQAPPPQPPGRLTPAVAWTSLVTALSTAGMQMLGGS